MGRAARMGAGFACAAAMWAGAAAADATTTVRVSVGTGGIQANSNSAQPRLSANGRYVAFLSIAPNLVPGDTNGVDDVFVRDRRTGTTTRVSVATGGGQGNADSFAQSISADGRYVAFESLATNLVPGDTNAASDIFVRDRKAHTTTGVSVGAGGVQGDADSLLPSISADGQDVAFMSNATDLVTGDTNAQPDIFVYDQTTHSTTRVSVGPGGVEANAGSAEAAISGNGRYVAFVSSATNLVPGDTNGFADVFIHDRTAHTTVRVSFGAPGTQANDRSDAPALSSDGRVIAFQSAATNLVPGDTNAHIDAFVRDRGRHTTTRVSVGAAGVQANRGSFTPAVSADGRRVAFTSWATNLVPHDRNASPDVFLRNRTARTTTRVSVSSTGRAGTMGSDQAAVSADGGVVAFWSVAPNLVPGDTNHASDVFARLLG